MERFSKLDISTVYLMLEYISKANNVGNKDNKTIRYLKGLAGIHCVDSKLVKPIDINFWCSKPFTKLAIIDELISSLRGNKINYVIFSDGEGLSRETVDFLNDRNIALVLKNNGIEKNNRLGDCEFLSLFNSVRKKSIYVELTAHNQDLIKMWDYLNEKVKNIYTFIDFPNTSSETDNQNYAFDYTDYQKCLDKIVQNAYISACSGTNTRELAAILSNSVHLTEATQEKYPLCAQTRKNLNLDLNGNVYACHCYGHLIGSIEDDHEQLVLNYDAHVQPLGNAECAACDALKICRGRCPYTDKSTTAEKAYCELARLNVSACKSFMNKFNYSLEDVEL